MTLLAETGKPSKSCTIQSISLDLLVCLLLLLFVLSLSLLPALVQILHDSVIDSDALLLVLVFIKRLV